MNQLPNFIRGTVVENRIGAEYEGKIWSRFLYLQISDGRILRLFDAYAIFGDIIVGESIAVIVQACFCSDFKYHTETVPTVQPDEWQGVITATDWQFPRIEYRVIDTGVIELFNQDYEPDFFKYVHCLVSTSMGDLLVSWGEFNKVKSEDQSVMPPIVGGIIQWKQCRYDLKAIL